MDSLKHPFRLMCLETNQISMTRFCAGGSLTALVNTKNKASRIF